MSDHLDRRSFLKAAALAGAGLGLEASRPAAGTAVAARPAFGGVPNSAPLATVRMGFVGVGHQGSSHVENLLKIPGVEIRAICDVVPEAARRSQAAVEAAGHTPPRLYTGRSAGVPADDRPGGH